LKIPIKFPTRKRLNRIAALFSAIILAGCAFSLPVEDLVSPPKLGAEQTEIYRALLSGKGSELTLKYPKTGEFRSPFVFFGDEVFVFYEISGETGEPAVWMTLLSQKNGRWECTYDISFFASDIEKVEFSAFGDNSEINAVISCSVTGAADKTVNVIAFGGNGAPQRVFGRTCAYYEINDFSGGGNKTLMTVVSLRDVKELRAYFAAWKDGEFREDESVDLNPDATGFVRVDGGFTQPETPALFLEYSKGDNTYNTGVIVRQSSRLYNAIYTPNEARRGINTAFLEKSPNAYTAYAYSRDIDGDGVTEAAGNADFPGYEGAGTVPVKAALWYAFREADRLEKLYYTYLSINGDYIFFFPEEWEGRVTVTVSADGREVCFWEFDAEKQEYYFNAEKELLRITAVPKGEAPPRDDWLFDTNSDERYDYYVKIDTDSFKFEKLAESLKFFGV